MRSGPVDCFEQCRPCGLEGSTPGGHKNVHLARVGYCEGGRSSRLWPHNFAEAVVSALAAAESSAAAALAHCVPLRTKGLLERWAETPRLPAGDFAAARNRGRGR